MGIALYVAYSDLFRIISPYMQSVAMGQTQLGIVVFFPLLHRVNSSYEHHGPKMTHKKDVD